MTGLSERPDCPFKAAAREGGLFEGPVGDDWWKCNCAECQAEKIEARTKPDPLPKPKRKRVISFSLSLKELAHYFMVVLRYFFRPKLSYVELFILGPLLFATDQPFWVVCLVIAAVCLIVSIMQSALGIKTK